MFGSVGGITLMMELLTKREDLELIQNALETIFVSISDEGTQVKHTV